MKRLVTYALAAAILAVALGLVLRVGSPSRPHATGSPLVPPAAPAPRPAVDRPNAADTLRKQLLDPSGEFDGQIAAIRALPSDLSDSELASLVELIRTPLPERVRRRAWPTLQNELMSVLGEQRIHWAGYGIAMEELVADRELEPVVRDYAVQHLTLWHGRRFASGDQSPADFARSMETCLSILGDPRDSFEPVSGTTLMSLCNLRGRCRPADLAPYLPRLETCINGLVSGTTPASLANRISAIQAAGRLRVTTALPAIRGLARGPAPHPSLRLSSVAALGYFGQQEDRPLLEQLAAGEPGLRIAATQALESRTINR